MTVHHLRLTVPADGQDWVAYEIQEQQGDDWVAVQAGLVENLSGSVAAPFTTDGSYRVLWVVDGGQSTLLDAEQQIGRPAGGFSYGGR